MPARLPLGQAPRPVGNGRLALVRRGGLAGPNMTKDEITVPGKGLAIAGDREIRTQFQGSLSQDGGRGVVYRDECTALVSGGNEFGEIAHIQPWIAGCFQPQQRCSIEQLDLRIPHCRRHTHLYP